MQETKQADKLLTNQKSKATISKNTQKTQKIQKTQKTQKTTTRKSVKNVEKCNPEKVKECEEKNMFNPGIGC